MSTDQARPADAKPKPKPKPKPAARQESDEPMKPAPAAPQKPAAPAAKPKSAAKPESASQAEVEDSAAEEAEQPEEEVASGGFAFTGLLLAVPSWLVSLIFHVVLLLLLALVTITNPDVREELFQTSSIEKEEEEELEEFEFENQEIEVLEPTEFTSPTLSDVGMADIGDITAPETSVSGEVSVHESAEAVDIGQLFGSEGTGMSEVGTGDGATTFFGVRTEGSHFMYVVDNSNSMNNGKFEHAIYELTNSIQQLSETSFFYIIFYSDAEYPLFYPNTVPRWVRATPENKHKVVYWLDTVHRCLQTRGEEAMAHAIKLRPDVLYLLGDGAFTDKATPKTLAMKGQVDVTINTLGFNMKSEHAKDFNQIASAFGGSFRDVKVDPQFTKLSKQKNRPKNNERNGDWGINLGKKKKKK